MLRPRPVVHRILLAGGLTATLTAALAVSLTFANDSAAAASGTGTERVSVDTAGRQAQLDSNEPAISADGRYVAFTTDEPFDPTDKIASSLGDAGTGSEFKPDADVYVRDTQLGTTTLISHGLHTDSGSTRVVPGNGQSDQPTISGDGRFVAFRTTSWNISNISYESAIVVCDRDPDGDGKLNPSCQFTVVSSGDESEPSNPHLSADGRRISFDVAPVQITILSRRNPALQDRSPAQVGGQPLVAASPSSSPSPSPSSSPSPSPSSSPSPSPSSSPSPSAKPSSSTGWVEIVELPRTDGDALKTPTDDDRTYVTSPSTLTIGGVDHDLAGQGDSTMAAGGTQVAFVAQYSNDGSYADVVQDYDVGTGQLTRLDVDASDRPIAEDGRQFRSPALSGDGRRYAFTDLQGAGRIGIRLYDRDPDGDGTFGRPTVEIASRAVDGTPGQGDQAAFSADGRYLAFTTPSANMHNGTDNAVRDAACLGTGRALSYCDVVVRDIVLDAARAAAGLPRLPAELASPSAACLNQPKPCEGTGDSGLPKATGDGSAVVTGNGRPVLSADGSAVAYGSAAADLISGTTDTNGHLDVFWRRFVPALAADPQDFGQVPLGAEALKNVTLTHVGAGPLHIRTVTVDPGDDFAVFPGETCTTAVLHVTDTCMVSIRFRPSALGARAATLRVTFDGSDTPFTVSLTGIGVPPPAPVFAATPDALDFGARPVLRTSPVKSVTISNVGDARLQVRAVALSATPFHVDYRITADGCGNTTIAPGGSCRIDVQHRPTAVGVRPAVLTIAYDGPNETTLTFSVNLTGTGTAPTLTSRPTVTPAGRVIQITGTDFPPNSTAKLSLVGMPGTTTAKAAANGTFTVPFVVLPNTWTGKHPLNADVLPATAPGLSAPLRATLEFLIVPGSPVPPDFDIRK